MKKDTEGIELLLSRARGSSTILLSGRGRGRGHVGWGQAQSNVAIGRVLPGPAPLLFGGVRGAQTAGLQGGVVVVVVERLRRGRRVVVVVVEWGESSGCRGHHRRGIRHAVGEGTGTHHHAWRLRLRLGLLLVGLRLFPRIHRGGSEERNEWITEMQECWLGFLFAG